MIQIHRYLITAVALSALSSSAQQQQCPDALVTIPGAKNVECSPYHGTHQISYDVDAHYPAEHLISHLKEELRTRGWLPLAEDFLNPGLPTSHVDGWSCFSDATVVPTQEVKQWMSDWVNLDGDVLHFTLRYRYPEGGPKELDRLQVVGILIPAHVARRERHDVLQRSKGEE
jgi:hypothetical protein